jgi:hypothetical protein
LALRLLGVFAVAELDVRVVARVRHLDVVPRRLAVRLVRLLAGDGLLAGRTELLAVVAEDGVATVRAVGVGHRRAFQQELAHLFGRRALFVLLFELLPELLAFGFLVEVAHTRTETGERIMTCGRGAGPRVARTRDTEKGFTSQRVSVPRV